MLSIESILDIIADINLINHLVSILLQSCCEDNNLVVFGHGLNELNTSRSHKEKAVILILLYKKYMLRTHYAVERFSNNLPLHYE